ncbi:MAG: carboxymuconolactone decarboxylase family protein [Pseudomonadota bacterium]
MQNYTTHTIENAPPAARPVLEAVKAKMGFVPNLMATMAESPVLVESYLTMMTLFDKTALTETERQIILMTNNRLNGCTYCMAAHTAVSQRAGVDDAIIEALRVFAIIVHRSRGRPTPEQIDAFLAAGYTKQTVLEVIVGTSLKVLSNYTTPITQPSLDKAFSSVAWSEDMAS